MLNLHTVLDNASPNPKRITLFRGEEVCGNFLGSNFMVGSDSAILRRECALSRAEIEFQEQEHAFHRILPLDLVPYAGEYVVSRDGRIVDHDVDLPTLTNRFFSRYGDLPVYITKIGEEESEAIDTPFLDE